MIELTCVDSAVDLSEYYHAMLDELINVTRVAMTISIKNVA